ncbi:hypothetical protein LCGC14_0448140 [marine sediment metagenome]|uniref:Uncharacterized protein n=1 Tax=marine sediment metagenome TaxID=412755 RepID=A0A0F9SPC0_9ZZZZ
MTFQWGTNPEYTITICHNWAWHSGELALPLKLSWWNNADVMGSKCNDISITILCFRFGLEIWRWKK